MCSDSAGNYRDAMLVAYVLRAGCQKMTLAVLTVYVDSLYNLENNINILMVLVHPTGFEPVAPRLGI